jgi:hypothetical protein
VKHGIGYMPGGVEVRRKPLSDKEKEEAERYRAERRRCVGLWPSSFMSSERLLELVGIALRIKESARGRHHETSAS